MCNIFDCTPWDFIITLNEERFINYQKFRRYTTMHATYSHDLGAKLIAIANNSTLELYKALGVKVKEKIAQLLLSEDPHSHHSREKHDSHYNKKSAAGSSFEPHSQPRDLEYEEAARKMVHLLSEHCRQDGNEHYKQLIIVAEPKMLGHVRILLPKPLRDILAKECDKNLVGHNDLALIEKNIFG